MMSDASSSRPLEFPRSPSPVKALLSVFQSCPRCNLPHCRWGVRRGSRRLSGNRPGAHGSPFTHHLQPSCTSPWSRSPAPRATESPLCCRSGSCRHVGEVYKFSQSVLLIARREQFIIVDGLFRVLTSLRSHTSKHAASFLGSLLQPGLYLWGQRPLASLTFEFPYSPSKTLISRPSAWICSCAAVLTHEDKELDRG